MLRRLALLVLVPLLPFGTALAQEVSSNWHEVAVLVGGNGTLRLGESGDGRYARQMPSEAWGEATPPIWVEFRATKERTTVRGAVPVPQGGSEAAVAALREELSAGARVVVRAVSPSRPVVRFVATGAFDAHGALAGSVQRSIRRTEPEALLRVDTTGTVVRTTADCEELFLIRAASGEEFDVGTLPEELREEGQIVHLVAKRRERVPGELLYFGCVGRWIGYAKVEHLVAAPEGTVLPTRDHRPRTDWSDVCEADALASLDLATLGTTEGPHALALAFDRIDGPGAAACRFCARPLERAEPSAPGAPPLHSCTHDALYFVGAPSAAHGPFAPVRR